MLTDASTDVPTIRSEVRRLARDHGIRIRTGMIGQALAVARVDADLWHESAAVMRTTLATSATPHVVR